MNLRSIRCAPLVGERLSSMLTTIPGATCLWANGHMPSAPIIANPEINPDRLFRNNGDGTFSDVSSSWGIDNNYLSRGMAYADFDNDGDIDIASMVINDNVVDSAKVHLFRNDYSGSGHYLQVQVEGRYDVHREGFGTHIIVHVNGKQWVHEVDGGSSHLSTHASTVHIGLGTDSIVDSLEVVWPGGKRQVHKSIPADQLITIKEYGPTDTLFSVTSVQADSSLPCYGDNTGRIVVSVSGNTNFLEYSIDGGSTYYNDSIFGNLDRGDYNVVVRNTISGKTISYASNPVAVYGPDELVIDTITVQFAVGSFPGEAEATVSGGNAAVYVFPGCRQVIREECCEIRRWPRRTG